MPRMKALPASSPMPDGAKVRLGTNRCNDRRLVTERDSSSLPDTAITDTGTRWRDSGRRRAVTTMSSSGGAEEGVAASAAGAGESSACASAGDNGIAAAVAKARPEASFRLLRLEGNRTPDTLGPAKLDWQPSRFL